MLGRVRVHPVMSAITIMTVRFQVEGLGKRCEVLDGYMSTNMMSPKVPVSCLASVANCNLLLLHSLSVLFSMTLRVDVSYKQLILTTFS